MDDVSRLRSLGLALVRQRHLLRDGLVEPVDYDVALSQLVETSRESAVALLDAVALIAVELVDTLRECVNAADGTTAVSAEDVFSVYLHDFGIPYS